MTDQSDEDAAAFFLNDDLPPFAQKIQYFTHKSAMRQAEVARRAGMTRDAFHRYYSGKTRPPPKKLLALAEAFGVKPEEIDDGASAAELELARIQGKSRSREIRETYRLAPPSGGDPLKIRLMCDVDLTTEDAMKIVQILNKYSA
jgi:transcriptional regulator with XRE-family HTH domain